MPLLTAVCRSLLRTALEIASQVIHNYRAGSSAVGIHQKENEMSDYTTKDRKRKLMMLGGLGLGLAMLGRKRRWRRYAMGQMMGGGYAGGPWGRFGGYGHGGPGGPQQTFTLPPFIEATLKAWHDRAHGTVPPAATGQSGTAQV
jgi:hypothetical protein